jgi:hypothetical protein
MFQPPSPRLSPSRSRVHDRPVCRTVSLPGRWMRNTGDSVTSGTARKSHVWPDLSPPESWAGQELDWSSMLRKQWDGAYRLRTHLDDINHSERKKKGTGSCLTCP